MLHHTYVGYTLAATVCDSESHCPGSCLIQLLCSCLPPWNAALQQIVQMARAADKEGHRTIGVLTKADTIEPGTHHTWLPVLQGSNYPLRLGYFCAVNPSQVGNRPLQGVAAPWHLTSCALPVCQLYTSQLHVERACPHGLQAVPHWPS